MGLMTYAACSICVRYSLVNMVKRTTQKGRWD